MDTQRIAGQAKEPSARNGPGECVQKIPVLEMLSEIFIDNVMFFLEFASKFSIVG